MAIIALGRMGSEGGTALLALVKCSERTDLSFFALKAIRMIGFDRFTLPAVLKELWIEDRHEPGTLAEMVSDLFDNRARVALFEILNHDDPLVRARAGPLHIDPEGFNFFPILDTVIL